jgi:hypothetical protein
MTKGRVGFPSGIGPRHAGTGCWGSQVSKARPHGMPEQAGAPFDFTLGFHSWICAGNTSLVSLSPLGCLQPAARTEIRRRKGGSPLIFAVSSQQMTVPRLWDRLNPTAPETKWLALVAGSLVDARGIAAHLLISVGSSCATGPLFMRKGRHALTVRSATERPA